MRRKARRPGEQTARLVAVAPLRALVEAARQALRGRGARVALLQAGRRAVEGVRSLALVADAAVPVGGGRGGIGSRGVVARRSGGDARRLGPAVGLAAGVLLHTLLRAVVAHPLLVPGLVALVIAAQPAVSVGAADALRDARHVLVAAEGIVVLGARVELRRRRRRSSRRRRAGRRDAPVHGIEALGRRRRRIGDALLDRLAHADAQAGAEAVVLVLLRDR